LKCELSKLKKAKNGEDKNGIASYQMIEN